jgi:hypothetical protein
MNPFRSKISGVSCRASVAEGSGEERFVSDRESNHWQRSTGADEVDDRYGDGARERWEKQRGEKKD